MHPLAISPTDNINGNTEDYFPLARYLSRHYSAYRSCIIVRRSHAHDYVLAILPLLIICHSRQQFSSLTVILIESTNGKPCPTSKLLPPLLHSSTWLIIRVKHTDITYGFPIMISVLVAKFVGDFFSEGLYEILIELKHRPLLVYLSSCSLRDFLILTTPLGV